MCIRSMINMIAKHKENTKYGSILNMGVSTINHVKHKSNKHDKYHTNQNMSHPKHHKHPYDHYVYACTLDLGHT